MSKKNKIQKQLLRAQIQENLQAVSGGKSIDQSLAQKAQTTPANSTSTTPNNNNIQPKENSEQKLIKKDIILSFSLSLVILLILVAIYFLDLKYDFLIKIANQIFSFLQS